MGHANFVAHAKKSANSFRDRSQVTRRRVATTREDATAQSTPSLNPPLFARLRNRTARGQEDRESEGRDRDKSARESSTRNTRSAQSSDSPSTRSLAQGEVGGVATISGFRMPMAWSPLRYFFAAARTRSDDTFSSIGVMSGIFFGSSPYR